MTEVDFHTILEIARYALAGVSGDEILDMLDMSDDEAERVLSEINLAIEESA